MTLTRRLPRLLPLLLAGALGACENETPTALDEDLVPVGPVTIEVRIPWSQFASNLRVLGGFGGADQVGLGFLANAYQSTLHARTLFHLGAFPIEASVRDSTGTTRTDTNLTFVGGTLMVRFDTEASTNAGPVRITAGRTLSEWDVRSADWINAVDTLGQTTRWPEAGGGPVAPLGSTVWERSVADSVVIALDSAGVAALADTASDRGVRLALDSPGERLQIKRISMQLSARPSVRRDTLLSLTVNPNDLTFIYTPDPAPPTGGLRVGGTPSWRSVFTVALPATVPGSTQACAQVACPIALTAEGITHAGLVLTTRATEAAFRPTDSLSIEARAVLAPEALPKSPLGAPLFLSEIGRTIGASLPVAGFQPGTPRTVELAITPFVDNLASGTNPDGKPASTTLALLSLHCPSEISSCFEPRSLTYASFAGPGEPGEPYLRLLLTVSRRLELP